MNEKKPDFIQNIVHKQQTHHLAAKTAPTKMSDIKNIIYTKHIVIYVWLVASGSCEPS